jgi:hypothetical protein
LREVVSHSVAAANGRLAVAERIPGKAKPRRDVAIVLVGDLAAVRRILAGYDEAVQRIARACHQIAAGIDFGSLGGIVESRNKVVQESVPVKRLAKDGIPGAEI